MFGRMETHNITFNFISMKIKLFLFAAFAAVATLAGCSDSKGGEETPIIPVDPEFAITVTPSEYAASITVTPTSDKAKASTYMLQVIADDIYGESNGNAKTCAEVVFEVLQLQNPDATMEDIVYYVTNEGKNKGTRKIQMTGLIPDTQFYVIVVGLTETGEFTTEAQLAPFMTKALPTLVPVSCTFDVKIPAVTAASVTVQVAPSVSTTPWIVQVLTKSDYMEFFGGSPEVIKETLDTDYMMVISNGNGIPMEELIKQLTLKGSKEVEIPLDAETEYIVFVCGIDAYGRATTDVVVKETKTLEFVPSDAAITSSTLKLYDGTEAVKLYPNEFDAAYSGAYFTRLSATFSETATQWIVLGTSDNLTSYKDPQVIQIMKGMVSEKKLQVMEVADGNTSDVYGVPYEGKEAMTVYLYAYAMNAAGEPGSVNRTEIVANKANLSDVSELAPAPEAVKAAVRFSTVSMENAEMQSIDLTKTYLGFKAMPAKTEVVTRL